MIVDTLENVLAERAKRHRHLCPRQALGARMGLYAAELLGLDLPRKDKLVPAAAHSLGIWRRRYSIVRS